MMMSKGIEEGFDPIELEHVIGFSGTESKLVCCHPKDGDYMIIGMGCNVVIQNLRDDHSQSFLKGHDEMVTAIATSPNGTFVASGQNGSSKLAVPEAEVIVWDLQQQVDVYHLRNVRGRVSCLAFSQDEVFLAGCGTDGSLFIWDMQTGEIVASMGSSDVGTALLWGPPQRGSNSHRPEYALYATVGHHVVAYRLVYSVANMQYQVVKTDFRLPAGMIREYMDACISPCGTTLILCTSVGDLSTYMLDSQVYRTSFPVCSGGARTLCSVGPYVFVGGGDGTIKRLTGQGSDWRLDLENSVLGAVTSLSGYVDNKTNRLTLLAGTSAGCVYEIDGTCLEVLRCIQNEVSPIVAVAFKRNCSIRFATLAHSGMVRVWDLSDYSVVSEAQPSRRDVGLCLTFDDHEDEVLTGSQSGTVRAYAVSRGGGSKVWQITTAHRDGVSSICATALYYATGGCNGGVRLWSRTSKAQLFEFSDHISKAVTSLLPDCRQAHLLHSCGEDRSVFTYDLKKEKRMIQHQWHRSGGFFTSMTQRLDSENELITAGSDGKLLTWDCDVPEPVSQVAVSSGSVSFSSVQVSPMSGRYIAASSSDARVRVWDLATGSLVASSPRIGFTDISNIAWSPDEKQIISVGLDKCICVWNFYAEALEQEQKQHHK